MGMLHALLYYMHDSPPDMHIHPKNHILAT